MSWRAESMTGLTDWLFWCELKHFTNKFANQINLWALFGAAEKNPVDLSLKLIWCFDHFLVASWVGSLSTQNISDLFFSMDTQLSLSNIVSLARKSTVFPKLCTVFYISTFCTDDQQKFKFYWIFAKIYILNTIPLFQIPVWDIKTFRILCQRWSHKTKTA